MNSLVKTLTVAALAAMPSGCASHTRAKTDWVSTAETTNTRGTGRTCIMQFDGRDVLRLTVPIDAKCIPKDGFFRVYSRYEAVDIWAVPEASTVSGAAGRAAHTIMGEFNDFKVESTTDLTIAGAPGKQLVGTGTELDGERVGRVRTRCEHQEQEYIWHVIGFLESRTKALILNRHDKRRRLDEPLGSSPAPQVHTIPTGADEPWAESVRHHVVRPPKTPAPKEHRNYG